MLSFDEKLEEVTTAALAAKAHQAVWWHHIGAESRSEVSAAFDYRQRIWSVNALAHRRAFYVIAAALFDPDRKVTSLVTLKSAASKQTKATDFEIINAALGRVQPLAAKVIRVRNDVYAHLPRLRTPLEAHRDVGLTGDETRELAAAGLDIANLIRLAVGKEAVVDPGDVVEEWRELLKNAAY